MQMCSNKFDLAKKKVVFLLWGPACRQAGCGGLPAGRQVVGEQPYPLQLSLLLSIFTEITSTIAVMSQNDQPAHCCPPFDPELWNEKVHEWKDRPFIRDSLPQFLHMPWPNTVRKTINRMWKIAQDAKAAVELKDFLLLSTDPSPWRSDLYMQVKHEIAGAENVKFSGNFYSKVFDGPFYRIPQFIRLMDIYLSKMGKMAEKYYFYFATCPKCAQKYGHNYIVAFAQVK
jgi:hypothetical protein